jgi:hypothetical protein
MHLVICWVGVSIRTDRSNCLASCSTRIVAMVCCRQVDEARRGELRALSVRKYLDALCVYFWAVTSLLFSIVTFALYVMTG